MQLTYTGTKISTLGEVFDFVRCVDKKRALNFNIESKVNPLTEGSTRSPEDFVAAQYAAFVKSGYQYEDRFPGLESRIHIYEKSFAWASFV